MNRYSYNIAMHCQICDFESLPTLKKFDDLVIVVSRREMSLQCLLTKKAEVLKKAV